MRVHVAEPIYLQTRFTHFDYDRPYTHRSTSRMSIKPKSHIEITIESMKVFMNDGQLDIAELNFLLGLALRDNGIDDDEKRVLKNIIARAEKSPMDPTTRAHVEQVKLEYDLG